MSADFDYRLETAALPDPTAVESYQSSEHSWDATGLEQSTYCGCGDDTCCGDCAEPGCGCDDLCEPGCGCDDCCDPGCGCDTCTGGCCGAFGCLDGGAVSPVWHVGFEWSLVQPRYSENIAFTSMQSDGANNSSFSDTEYDYDLELTPRAWVEAKLHENWSWRISYWQFDHKPTTAAGSPDENGFGEITHPEFGDVDISTTIPTDTFTAAGFLNAYSIDIEAVKRAQLGDWLLGVGGGLRYASAEQGYFAELRNTGNVLRGQIDFAHEIEGIGPTLSLSARRPLHDRIRLVCSGRGSLLFGDGSSRLIAGEDLDLTNPFTTTRLTNRDDLLPIGEARVGVEWLSPRSGRGGFQWLLSTAIEGQVWGDAGNSVSESSDLGFFGFNIGAGVLR